MDGKLKSSLEWPYVTLQKLFVLLVIFLWGGVWGGGGGAK